MVKKDIYRKRIVVYGSLYINEGQDWIYAKEQLMYLLKEKRRATALFFDVVGNSDQKEEGEAMVDKIKGYANRKRPDLDEIRVSFTINAETNTQRQD